MIFVTVGTHEQSFERLVKAVDDMKGRGIITEDVVIQTGYTDYEPEHCEFKKLFPYQDMEKYVKAARIVITHGGPSSFIMPLQEGKIPVVFPRKKQYEEHVNDHQVKFTRAIEQRMGNIIVAETAEKLEDVLVNYDEYVKKLPASMRSNNAAFCDRFERAVSIVMRH